jgi:hypothetical protein
MMRPSFSWLCHQEPLPWFGDQIDGSVIPLHVDGRNGSAHYVTSHPPTNTLSVYLYYGFPFVTKNLFTSFSRIIGRSISKVSFLALKSCQLFLPSGHLSPSSHKARYNTSHYLMEKDLLLLQD